MNETLSFSNQKRTIHFTVRNGFLRIVVKSAKYIPDTMVAMISEHDLPFIQTMTSTATLTTVTPHLPYSTCIEKVSFLQDEKKIQLMHGKEVVTFLFSNEEWNKIMKHIE